MRRLEYERRTDADWRGTRVRTRRPLSTQHLAIPAGTVLTITRKFSGFNLQTDPCAHCGVAVRITKVPYTDVDEDGAPLS